MEKSQKLQELRERVGVFTPSKKHDIFAVEAIKEAINAAENGNFGIGAILVDNETSEIAYRGQNKVFSDSRSDLHGEMDLLNNFESQNKEKSRELIKKYTLYSSLESCPMCLCRVITSGVMEMYHVADDAPGGMVNQYEQLPPVWKEISSGRIYKKAECSDELSSISEELFLATVHLDSELK
jgi:cytosine deaminase